MRDRLVRLTFVMIILALPIGIELAAGSMARPLDVATAGPTARASFHLGTSSWVPGVQTVLLAGMMLAGRERMRLQAERNPTM